MKFSERLKETLKEQGLQQKKLAEMLGIKNKSSISNWLRSDCYPNLELFYRICLILDESADYLLGLED